jgi:hypothetical protein
MTLNASVEYIIILMDQPNWNDGVNLIFADLQKINIPLQQNIFQVFYICSVRVLSICIPSFC